MIAAGARAFLSCGRGADGAGRPGHLTGRDFMPAGDAKKKAAAIEKGMKHAREALALLANELGGQKGAPGKEMSKVLNDFQKVEASFKAAAKGL